MLGGFWGKVLLADVAIAVLICTSGNPNGLLATGMY